MVRREIEKKKKEVLVSNNVGVIAASLRNKQIHMNNGQFNGRQSLEAVSIFETFFFFQFVTHLLHALSTELRHAH
jgi:hypothetical protein